MPTNPGYGPPPPRAGSRATVNTVSMNFKVSPHMRARIEKYRRQAGLSLADAMRVLLDKQLTREGITEG